MERSLYRIAVPQIPAVPIAGGGLFPVRRIYTVGRNYRAHAAEVHAGGVASTPGLSLKPADSIVAEGGDVAYPPGTKELDPEVELVFAIGRTGADVERDAAQKNIFGYAVGFDMIRRDIMRECIANNHSWDMCKSFDGAAPISAIAPVSMVGHPESGAIWIDVNGERRQTGDLAEQIWNPAEIVSRLSRLSRIEPGDLVFTGTPAGPAPVQRGDRLHGHIDGVGDLHATIV